MPKGKHRYMSSTNGKTNEYGCGSYSAVQFLGGRCDEAAEKGADDRMTAYNVFFTTFFMLWRNEVFVRQRDRNTATGKDGVDKTLNRAMSAVDQGVRQTPSLTICEQRGESDCPFSKHHQSSRRMQ